MDDKTARKIRREHLKLLKDLKKYQNLLFKTSVSSKEFGIYKSRYHAVEKEIDDRSSEFRLAFAVLFSPAFADNK